MQQQIDYHNSRISFRIVGKGPVVILLHGFGEDSSVWDVFLPALNDFKLIIPDLPGTGQSEMIEDMSMEGMAEVVRNLIPLPGPPPKQGGTATGQPEKIVLIGHSMGGYISLAFAEKYPELLRGLGLFHSSAYADSEEKKKTRRKGIEFIREHGPFEFLKTAIPNLYAPETKGKRPKIIEEQINASHNFSGAALVSYYESMMKRPDRTNILKNLKVPVLFILGKHDAAVPLQDGLEQCILPDLSYIHVLEHSGHMGMKEATDESTTILLTFLNSTAEP